MPGAANFPGTFRDTPGHRKNPFPRTAENGGFAGSGGLNVSPVALINGLLSRTRRVLEIAETGTTSLSRLPRGINFNLTTALAPILPPSLPFSEVSASTALACPPVTRAVDLYTTAFLRLSWQSDHQPTLAWLAAPVGGVPARLRDARTLQDLILHNRALWLVARDGEGQIIEAAHIPTEFWGWNETAALVFQDQVVPATAMSHFVVFYGAKPQPFLDTAKVTLQHYAAIAQTMLDRSETPIALHELTPTEDYNGLAPGEPGYEEEYDALLNAQKSYAAARGKRGGAGTITPQNVKLNIHQVEDDGQMLLGARDAVRKDVANFLNINASMLDGASSNSDYANTLQNRNEFLELSLALFLAPITERLSMDDVSPEGATVSLNLPEFDAAPADARGNQGAAVAAPADTKENE